MMVPMRSATTYRNSRSSAGYQHDQHGKLAEFDTHIERQQRGQQVRTRKLQRLPERE